MKCAEHRTDIIHKTVDINHKRIGNCSHVHELNAPIHFLAGRPCLRMYSTYLPSWPLKMATAKEEKRQFRASGGKEAGETALKLSIGRPVIPWCYVQWCWRLQKLANGRFWYFALFVGLEVSLEDRYIATKAVLWTMWHWYIPVAALSAVLCAYQVDGLLLRRQLYL